MNRNKNEKQPLLPSDQPGSRNYGAPDEIHIDILANQGRADADFFASNLNSGSSNQDKRSSNGSSDGSSDGSDVSSLDSGDMGKQPRRRKAKKNRKKLATERFHNLPKAEWAVDSPFTCFHDAEVKIQHNLLVITKLKLLGSYVNKSYTYKVLIPNNDPSGQPYKEVLAHGYVEFEGDEETWPGMADRHKSFVDKGNGWITGYKRRFHDILSDWKKGLTILCLLFPFAASLITFLAHTAAIILRIIDAIFASDPRFFSAFIQISPEAANDLHALIYERQAISIVAASLDGLGLTAETINSICMYAAFTVACIVIIDSHARQPFQDVAEHIKIGEKDRIVLPPTDIDHLSNYETAPAYHNYVVRIDAKGKEKYYIIKGGTKFLRDQFKKKVKEPAPKPERKLITRPDTPQTSDSDTESLPPNDSPSLSKSSRNSSFSSLNSFSSEPSDEITHTNHAAITYRGVLAPKNKEIIGKSSVAHNNSGLTNILDENNPANKLHQDVMAELIKKHGHRNTEAQFTKHQPKIINFTTELNQTDAVSDNYSLLATSRNEFFQTLLNKKDDLQSRHFLVPTIRTYLEKSETYQALIVKKADLEARMKTLIMLARGFYQANEIPHFPSLVARASLDRNYPNWLPSYQALAELNNEHREIRNSIDSNSEQAQTVAELARTLELNQELQSETNYENFLNACKNTGYFTPDLARLYCQIKEQPLRVWVKERELSEDNIQNITLDLSKSYLPDDKPNAPNAIDVLYHDSAEPSIQRLKETTAPNPSLQEDQVSIKVSSTTKTHRKTKNIDNQRERNIQDEFSQQTIQALDKLGFTIQPTEPDGHCFYNAVAQHLATMNHKDLRHHVATNLETSQDYHGFITLANNQTMEDFINSIKDGNEHADNVEIKLLMCILNRPIVTIGPEQLIHNLHDLQNSNFTGEPIFVYFEPGKIITDPVRKETIELSGHYSGLTLKQGFDPREMLNELIVKTQNRHTALKSSPRNTNASPSIRPKVRPLPTSNSSRNHEQSHDSPTSQHSITNNTHTLFHDTPTHARDSLNSPHKKPTKEKALSEIRSDGEDTNSYQSDNSSSNASEKRGYTPLQSPASPVSYRK